MAPEAGIALPHWGEMSGYRMRRRARDDDAAWLEDLSARHGRMLWRYVLGLERDRETVEEIVSSVLWAAHRNAASLRGRSEQQLQAWLRRTAYNLTANSARQAMARRRLVERVARESVLSMSDEDSATDENKRSARVGEILATLRDDYRLVLTMNALGRPAAETAELLGVSVNAARKRLLRAREAFREADLRGAAADDDSTGATDG